MKARGRAFVELLSDSEGMERTVILLTLTFALLRVPLAYVSPPTGDSGKHLYLIQGMGEGTIPLSIFWRPVETLFSSEPSVLVNPPLFHLTSVLFYRVGDPLGAGLAAAKLVSPLATVLVIYLAYLFGKRVSLRVGIYSAFVASVFPYLFVMGTVPYRNALFAAAFLAFVYLYSAAVERDGRRWTLYAGVALGLLLLSKKQAPIVFAFLGVALLLHRSRWRQTVTIGLLGTLLFLPLVARNMAVFGKPVLLDTFASPTASLSTPTTLGFSPRSLSHFHVGYLEMWGIPDGDLTIAYSSMGTLLPDTAILILVTGWFAVTVTCTLALIYGFRRSQKIFRQDHFLQNLEVMGAVLLPTLLFMALFGSFLPKFRHVLPVVALFSVYAGIALAALRNRGTTRALSVAVILVLLFSSLVVLPVAKPFVAAQAVDRYGDGATYVGAHTEPGDVVASPFYTYLTFETGTRTPWPSGEESLTEFLEENDVEYLFIPKGYTKKADLKRIGERHTEAQGLDGTRLEKVYDDGHSIIYKTLSRREAGT